MKLPQFFRDIKEKLRPARYKWSQSRLIKANTNTYNNYHGYKMDINNPQTFTEKIQWYKFYYDNDKFVNIVDKYLFKNYIKEKLGEGYTIPFLGYWTNIKDLEKDWDKLPEEFCLKSTLSSGGLNIKMIHNKVSKPKRKRSCFRLSEELKLEVVRDYLLNGIDQCQIAKQYGISQQSVSRIIRIFAASNDKSALLMKNTPTDNQAEEIKALRAEILELKKKLHQETMRADFYDTMVDVAEEMFNIEIRKKAGTGQSKGCMKTK